MQRSVADMSGMGR